MENMVKVVKNVKEKSLWDQMCERMDDPHIDEATMKKIEEEAREIGLPLVQSYDDTPDGMLVYVMPDETKRIGPPAMHKELIVEIKAEREGGEGG